MNIKTLALATILTITCTGCLMPYQESFSCQADLGAGRCGMVRDNYKFVNENVEKDFLYIFDENKTKDEIKNHKSQDKDCSNYTSDIQKYHECHSSQYEYILLKKTNKTGE